MHYMPTPTHPYMMPVNGAHTHAQAAHPHAHAHVHQGHMQSPAHHLAPNTGPIRTELPQRKRPKYTRSKTGCLTCRGKKIKVHSHHAGCRATVLISSSAMKQSRIAHDALMDSEMWVNLAVAWR